MGYRLLNISQRAAAGWLGATLWLCGSAANAQSSGSTSGTTPGTTPTTVVQPTVPAPYVPAKPAKKGKIKVVRPRRRPAVVYYRPAVRRGRAGSQPARAARGPSIRRMNAAVDLTTELQALRTRHPGFYDKLPTDIRRLEREALPTIDKLPQLASYSYLTSVEEYGNMSSADQGRLRDTLQSIADVPDTDRTRFVQAATTRFDALQNDPTQVKSARTRPLDTFYVLKGEVDNLKTAATQPAGTQQLVPLGKP